MTIISRDPRIKETCARSIVLCQLHRICKQRVCCPLASTPSLVSRSKRLQVEEIGIVNLLILNIRSFTIHPVLSCVFQESNCLVFRATADQCDTWITIEIPSYVYVYIHNS